MYTSRSTTMKWSTAAARDQFADLVRAAAGTPQPIYSRDRLVAVVINPDTFAAFEAWQAALGEASLGDTFAEIRLVAAEEDWCLRVPYRADRPNPFADDDDLAR